MVEPKKEVKQKEFKNMPQMTELGKKARDFTDVLSKIESWKAKLDDTRVELISLFKKEKRQTITVDGITLTYAHLEKDQIKVKQPE